MNILINGACGRMGSELCALLACGYRGHTVTAAVDPAAADGSHICHTLELCPQSVDVLIDFSHHSAAPVLCAYVLQQKLPAVIATTGYTDAELALIRHAAETVPIFLAANLSLGIALLNQLALTAAAALPEAEIEIIELHHSKKRDAPSGTAQKLAEELCALRPEGRVVCGAGCGVRTPDEIRLHSLRMGDHAGSHTVCFGSNEQTLTLTHTAHSPRIYAVGAIRAAEFLLTQKPGLYGMPQLLSHLHIL